MLIVSAYPRGWSCSLCSWLSSITVVKIARPCWWPLVQWPPPAWSFSAASPSWAMSRTGWKKGVVPHCKCLSSARASRPSVALSSHAVFMLISVARLLSGVLSQPCWCHYGVPALTSRAVRVSECFLCTSARCHFWLTWCISRVAQCNTAKLYQIRDLPWPPRVAPFHRPKPPQTAAAIDSLRSLTPCHYPVGNAP